MVEEIFLNARFHRVEAWTRTLSHSRRHALERGFGLAEELQRAHSQSVVMIHSARKASTGFIDAALRAGK